ncbi:MAG: SPOR domain-containing protein [Caulobacter sp.]|nr:SPOR domain-containing protein [Caulobacter sp.]
MSDHDRGAYTPPTDSPLSFDARRPVRGGGGPGGSTLLISALILVVLVAGAGFWLYKDGQRGADDAPQPVGTQVETAKSAPKADEQPEPDASAGLTIHTDDAAEGAAPTFAPAPEDPAPRPAPTAPVTTAELRPAGPVAAPAPRPVPVTPATTPAAKPAPTKPVASMPATPPKAVTPAATGGGAAGVQIGAFSSQALADRGWSDAAAIAPGMAAGKGKRVEAVDKDGKTLYRTTMTGFASRADAAAFCDRLKAAGKSCFVK